MVRSGCKTKTKLPNPLNCDEAKTGQQREYIQSQTDYRQSVLIIGTCLDLRPSSEKLLLKSVRILLRKKKKKARYFSIWSYYIKHCTHSKNAQKDIKQIPFQGKINYFWLTFSYVPSDADLGIACSCTKFCFKTCKIYAMSKEKTV